MPEPQRVKTYEVVVEKPEVEGVEMEEVESDEPPRLEHYEVGIEREMVVLYL